MVNSHSCVEPGDEARKEHKTQAVFDVCTLEACSGHSCTAQTFGRKACTYNI